jgi:hypothetical protein
MQSHILFSVFTTAKSRYGKQKTALLISLAGRPIPDLYMQGLGQTGKISPFPEVNTILELYRL